MGWKRGERERGRAREREGDRERERERERERDRTVNHPMVIENTAFLYIYCMFYDGVPGSNWIKLEGLNRKSFPEVAEISLT